MRIYSRSTLRDFWLSHADSELALREWYAAVTAADWQSPAQVLARFPTASVVGSDRVIFRIRGNEYRLIVEIAYERRRVYIRFVGTHAEYNRIRVGEV